MRTLLNVQRKNADLSKAMTMLRHLNPLQIGLTVMALLLICLIVLNRFLATRHVTTRRPRACRNILCPLCQTPSMDGTHSSRNSSDHTPWPPTPSPPETKRLTDVELGRWDSSSSGTSTDSLRRRRAEGEMVDRER
jgi:hypothetical protein